MAPLRYAAKLDPFLSLDCAPTPSILAQSKERKGSHFAIWQHRYAEPRGAAADPHLAGGETDAMMYRLRSFSISPKGALIKHGDQIRSRSSAGSTANTSR